MWARVHVVTDAHGPRTYLVIGYKGRLFASGVLVREQHALVVAVQLGKNL